MRPNRAILLATFLPFFFQCARAAEKSAMTPDQAAALATRISADDPKIQTLHVRAKLEKSESLFEADLFLQKPNHCALVVWDGRQGAPLLVAADGEALVYDASRGTIFSYHGWPAMFLRTAQDGSVSFYFNVDVRETAPRLGDIVFDLRGIIDLNPLQRRIREDSPTEYTLFGASETGKHFTARVAPASPFPFLNLKYCTAGEVSLCIVLEQIEVDSKLSDKVFSMPALARLSSRIPIQQSDRITDDIARAMNFRTAMLRPSFRIDDPEFDGTDWEAVAKKDADVGQFMWSEINRVTGNLYAGRGQPLKPPATRPVATGETKVADDPQLAQDLDAFWRFYRFTTFVDQDARDRLIVWGNARPNDGEAQFIAAVSAEFTALPTSPEFKKIATQLKHACDLGYAPAYASLAYNYEMQGNHKDAIEALRRGVQLNDPRAAEQFGTAFLSGKGADRNLGEATALFDKALDSGWSPAYFGLAKVNEARGQIPQAIRALQAGASAGVPMCLGELALARLSGPLPDFNEAFRLMKQGAEMGQPMCEHYLGLFYGNGTGTTRDQQKSIEWLNRALSHGDSDAAIPLAEMLTAKGATPQMKEQAVTVLSEADAAGNGQASYHLAELYMDSKDPSRIDLARQLLKRAVDRGVNEAADALQKLDAGSTVNNVTPTSQSTKSSSSQH